MKNEASEIKNLSHGEAIEKFKELANHQSVCLFTTQLTKVPLTTRPMSIQKVCDQGNFWFLSPSDSDKNYEIAEDPRVQLFLSNTSDYEFLSLYGKATITRDREKIEELWSDIAKAWFHEGKDDPRITVIKFAPEEGFYWDTKDGKLISLIKIAASALTGKTYQEGVEGSIVR
jgi:general stress protein 26